MSNHTQPVRGIVLIRKFCAIVVVVAWSGGWLPAATASVISSPVLNTYSSNFALDGRYASGSVNGLATKDSFVFSDSWMTSTGTSGDISWFLNGRYALNTIDVYNFREVARGASNVVVSISNDYGKTYTSLGNYVFNKAPVSGPNTPTTLNLGGVAATSVKFQITGNYGDPTWVGLNEVSFNGTAHDRVGQIPITVSAFSSQFTGREASHTVDGVLDTTDVSKMWLSAFGDNTPTITFSLGATPLVLDHLNVWNYNEPSLATEGLNDIRVQFFDASMVSLGLAVDDADGDNTFTLTDAKGQITTVMDAIEFRNAPAASFFRIITLSNPSVSFGGLTEVQAFELMIPEPSMVMLLGVGGLLLGRRLRRRGGVVEWGERRSSGVME